MLLSITRDKYTRLHKIATTCSSRAEEERLNRAYQRAGYIRTVLASSYGTEAEATAEARSLAQWMRKHGWKGVELAGAEVPGREYPL